MRVVSVFHMPTVFDRFIRASFKMKSLPSSLLICLCAFVLLAACGKPAPSAAPEAEIKPVGKNQHSGSTETDVAEFEKLITPTVESSSPKEVALEKQVEDILDKHSQMTAQELLEVPEVKQKVIEFLKQLGQSPDLQKRMNSSIAFAAGMKNLKEPKENLDFKMDLSGYTKDRTRALLKSLYSNSANRVLDFFEKEVSEAAVEFTLNPGSAKSSNGISLESKTPAP